MGLPPAVSSHFRLCGSTSLKIGTYTLDYVFDQLTNFQPIPLHTTRTRKRHARSLRRFEVTEERPNLLVGLAVDAAFGIHVFTKNLTRLACYDAE